MLKFQVVYTAITIGFLLLGISNGLDDVFHSRQKLLSHYQSLRRLSSRQIGFSGYQMRGVVPSIPFTLPQREQRPVYNYISPLTEHSKNLESHTKYGAPVAESEPQLPEMLIPPSRRRLPTNVLFLEEAPAYGGDSGVFHSTNTRSKEVPNEIAEDELDDLNATLDADAVVLTHFRKPQNNYQLVKYIKRVRR